MYNTQATADVIPGMCSNGRSPLSVYSVKISSLTDYGWIVDCDKHYTPQQMAFSRLLSFPSLVVSRISVARWYRDTSNVVLIFKIVYHRHKVASLSAQLQL